MRFILFIFVRLKIEFSEANKKSKDMQENANRMKRQFSNDISRWGICDRPPIPIAARCHRKRK